MRVTIPHLFLLPICAILLVGCQSVTAGPARIGGSDSELCTTAGNNRQVLVGEIIGAPSGGALSLIGVELLDPVGLSLIGSWVLPIMPGVAVLGTSRGDPSELNAWSERSDASSATVEADADVSLVLQLKVTGNDKGTARAVAVTYSYDDSTFRKETTMKVTVMRDKPCGDG